MALEWLLVFVMFPISSLVLIYFQIVLGYLKGVSTYPERFVAQPRAPLLKRLDITLFNQIAFTLPHLSNFIDRTEGLILPTAKISFWIDKISILLGPTSKQPHDEYLILRMLCKQLDWQIDCMGQVCSALVTELSLVERLTRP